MSAIRSVRLTLRLTPEQQRLIDAVPERLKRLGVPAKMGDDPCVGVNLFFLDADMDACGERDGVDTIRVAQEWGKLEEYNRSIVTFGEHGSMCVGHSWSSLDSLKNARQHYAIPEDFYVRSASNLTPIRQSEDDCA